jgi:glutathione S-transferase
MEQGDSGHVDKADKGDKPAACARVLVLCVARAVLGCHASCKEQGMTMQFFMTPGSCSTGIHILLEELELPFQVTIVNLPAGDHRKPAYLAINPKGTIPTLVLSDGRALTSFQSIAFWLARAFPRKGLLPEDVGQATTLMALMEHAVSTVHGQGYTRIFTTDAYLPRGLEGAERERWQAAIVERGREIVREAFDIIEAALPDTGYAGGEKLTIADAALFYVEFWADKVGIVLPPRCQAHYQRMRARPVVRQVLAEEGYR